MHPKYVRACGWTERVIGAAIEVHRDKGPGLLEDIYERCLMRELELQSIPAVNKIEAPVEYKGLRFNYPLKVDVLVDECLLLELKAAERILPIHKAQLMSYMKLLDIPLGLLINFHALRLVDGVVRFMLPGADGKPVCRRREEGEFEHRDNRGNGADFVQSFSRPRGKE